MPERTLGIKELHRNLPKIANAAQRGASFVVLRRATPVFRIEPVRARRVRRHTFADLDRLMFSLPRRDPKLSQKIDRIVYGV